MKPLEALRAYSEANRVQVWIISGLLTLSIAVVDWQLPKVSLGFLYVAPVLLVAGTFENRLVLILGAICGVLREQFNPLHNEPGAVARILV